MKKLFATVMTLAICVLSWLGAPWLAGCSAKTYDVATVDDLYAMEKGKNYRLVADIDLAGREWKTLRADSFDGGGHTVKNAVMYSGGGFFGDTDVSNATFENLNVMSESLNFGFVASSGNMKNVHVKNSTVTLTVTSGYLYVGAIVGNSMDVESCSATDCTVNCNLSGNVCLGGIAGKVTRSISGCSARSVTIKGKGGSYLRGGGIVGFFDGNDTTEISDCRVADCTINLTTGTAYVGGIVGSSVQSVSDRDSGSIRRCVSDGNTIDVAPETYEAAVGGIIGFSSSELVDCLSKNNSLSLDAGSKKGYVGGVVGATQRNMEKCIGYGNTLNDVRSAGGAYCGFVAASSAMAAHCATHDVTIVGAQNKDEFALDSTEITMYCYYDGMNNGFTAEQWLDGNTVQTALSLDPNVWTATSGELPDIIKGATE